jgi:hypothetical protein
LLPWLALVLLGPAAEPAPDPLLPWLALVLLAWAADTAPEPCPLPCTAALVLLAWAADTAPEPCPLPWLALVLLGPAADAAPDPCPLPAAVFPEPWASLSWSWLSLWLFLSPPLPPFSPSPLSPLPSPPSPLLPGWNATTSSAAAAFVITAGVPLPRLGIGGAGFRDAAISTTSGELAS